MSVAVASMRVVMVSMSVFGFVQTGGFAAVFAGLSIFGIKFFLAHICFK
jgi:hypothetical protein